MLLFLSDLPDELFKQNQKDAFQPADQVLGYMRTADPGLSKRHGSAADRDTDVEENELQSAQIGQLSFVLVSGFPIPHAYQGDHASCQSGSVS